MRHYASFDVVFRADDSGRVFVYHRDLGNPEEPFEPPFAQSPEEMRAEEIGSELFQALFRGSLAMKFQDALARIGRDDIQGVRLRLAIDPAQPQLAEIAALPWELLYDPYRKRFLALDLQTPVVRFLNVRAATPPIATEPPLSILLGYAEPRGVPSLDFLREETQLREAVRRTGVKIEKFRVQRLTELRERLRNSRFEILHLMAHGRIRAATGEGELLFEDSRQRAQPVSGRQLAAVLSGIPSLRLVFLNACNTATSKPASGGDPYSDVAAALIRHAEIPAVVAMRAPIADRSALAFSEIFYQRLQAEAPIEAALTEARLRLFQEKDESPTWATPTMFLQTRAADLFDLSGNERLITWWGALKAALAALVIVGIGMLLGAVYLWTYPTTVPPDQKAASPSVLERCRDPVAEELGLEFVVVPPGRSQIGSERQDDLEASEVFLAYPLCVSAYEVTEAQWAEVMDWTEDDPPSEKLPKTHVSYEKARTFLERLNEMGTTEGSIRLPKEYEWEYVAQTGLNPLVDLASGGGLALYANCGPWLERDRFDDVAPTGSFEPNKWGVYDMLGNVFEWVETVEPEADGKVVRRGGSYKSGKGQCRPEERRPVLPTEPHFDSGLRLVRELTPEPDS